MICRRTKQYEKWEILPSNCWGQINKDPFTQLSLLHGIYLKWKRYCPVLQTVLYSPLSPHRLVHILSFTLFSNVLSSGFYQKTCMLVGAVMSCLFCQSWFSDANIFVSLGSSWHMKAHVLLPMHLLMSWPPVMENEQGLPSIYTL